MYDVGVSTGDLAELLDEVGGPQRVECRREHGALRQACSEGPVPAADAIHFHAGSAVPEQLEDPGDEASWKMFEEFEVEHPMVDGVVCSGKVIRDQDELVRCGTIHRAAAGVRHVPAVLHRLDQPGQVVLRSSASAEAHLLWRDQTLQLT